MKLLGFITLALSVAAMAVPVEITTFGQSGAKGKFDPTGTDATKGICIDIIKAVMKTDPEIKITGFETLKPLPEVEAAVENGTVDVFFGLLKTPAREAKVDFIDPKIYTIRHKIAVKSIDKDLKINGFDDLRKLDGVIATNQGTAYIEFLDKQGGLKVDSSSKDPGAIMKKLSLGLNNIRFYYQNDVNLFDYIKENKMENTLIILPYTFKEESQFVVASNKLSPETRKKLAAALSKLEKSGELKRIFSAYAPS